MVVVKVRVKKKDGTICVGASLFITWTHREYKREASLGRGDNKRITLAFLGISMLPRD